MNRASMVCTFSGLSCNRDGRLFRERGRLGCFDSRQEAAKQCLNVSDQISNRPRLCHLRSTDRFVQLESETLVFPRHN